MNAELWRAWAPTTSRARRSASAARKIPRVIDGEDDPRLAADLLDGGSTPIGSSVAEIVFDAQQLVVLGNAIATGRRTSLDLAAVRSHSKIGDGGVFGFTRAM